MSKLMIVVDDLGPSDLDRHIIAELIQDNAIEILVMSQQLRGQCKVPTFALEMSIGMISMARTEAMVYQLVDNSPLYVKTKSRRSGQNIDPWRHKK